MESFIKNTPMQGCIGDFLYPVSTAERVLENVKLGGEKSERDKEGSDYGEDGNGELGLFADYLVFMKHARLVDI